MNNYTLDGEGIYESSLSEQITPEDIAISSGSSQTNSNDLNSAEYEPKASNCGHFAVMTQCLGEQKHTILMSLNCGQEWCPTCGQDGSHAHLRRISRVLPKARQIASMGYLVIEYPNDCRSALRNTEFLNDQYKRVMSCLKGTKRGQGRNGWFKRGLIRMHFFGDKVTGKYNPHFNVLVDAEYMPHDKLNELKQALREACGVSNLIIHYSFVSPGDPQYIAKMYHRVRYVTRATFKNLNWDVELAWDLKNFRNQRWWGKWNDAPVWDITRNGPEGDFEALHALEHIFNHKCPVCGAELHKWTRPVNSKFIKLFKAVPIGNSGVYIAPESPEFNGNRLNLADIEALDKKQREFDKTSLKISIGGSFLPSNEVDEQIALLHRRNRNIATNWNLYRNDPEYEGYWLGD